MGTRIQKESLTRVTDDNLHNLKVNVMTNILLIIFNVMLVGAVMAVTGSLLVRLLRTLLAEPRPPDSHADRLE